MKNKKFKKITIGQIKKLSKFTENQTKIFFPILGKNKNEPISFLKILECTDLDFTLKCLYALPKPANKSIKLLSHTFAKEVAHLTNNEESANVIKVYHRFAKGEATIKELTKAQSKARFSAYENKTKSRAAAWTIAWAGTWLGDPPWTAKKARSVLYANTEKGMMLSKTFNEVKNQQKEIFKKWIIENEAR